MPKSTVFMPFVIDPNALKHLNGSSYIRTLLGSTLWGGVKLLNHIPTPTAADTHMMVVNRTFIRVAPNSEYFLTYVYMIANITDMSSSELLASMRFISESDRVTELVYPFL